MKKLKSEISLKEQVGAVGYFAAVSLSAVLSEGEEKQMVVDISDSVPLEWREAASVGLRIGWRCLSTKHKLGKELAVTIESIKSMPCDTSEVVVMYVAAKALLLLFEANPPNSLAFVPEFGAFLFGK